MSLDPDQAIVGDKFGARWWTVRQGPLRPSVHRDGLQRLCELMKRSSVELCVTRAFHAVCMSSRVVGPPLTSVVDATMFRLQCTSQLVAHETLMSCACVCVWRCAALSAVDIDPQLWTVCVQH